MRKLVTGVDAEGRSCIVDEIDLEMTSNRFGTSSAKVWVTPSPPPVRPPGAGRHTDLGVAPGEARWLVVEFEPNTTASMHHTDTVDLDLVLEGSIELGLDDGAHVLGPGDCVVMTGVDHSWTTRDERCRFAVVAIGTPPRPDA